jgi:hypothetical protein
VHGKEEITMEIYKPKTMPYDMKIDDALKFARKELYLVNRSLRSLSKYSDSVTYGMVLSYKVCIMEKLSELKKLKIDGIKRVNVLQ